MARTEESELLFTREGHPPIAQVIPMALQHVFASVVGMVTPALIVASACNMNAEETNMLIQASLILSGVSTLIQSYPLFGRMGASLPIVMGASFAYVPTLVSIGANYGYATIIGAELIGASVSILFGVFLKRLRKFFPPVVTGTVVLTIGMSLYSVGVNYMAGGAGTENFGSLQSWIIAAVTLIACIFFANFTKGITQLASILFGMIVGYIASLLLGAVDFGSLDGVGWFALPQFMPQGINFEPAAITTLAIVFIPEVVEALGDYTSLCVGALDRQPTTKELRRGIISQGIMTSLGSLIGGIPTATYGQNVGIVITNRVINRTVFGAIGSMLIVAGFIPKFAALIQTIPQPVIGGATINVFGVIAMTGVRVICDKGLTQRRATIAGTSVALGIGIANVAGCLSGPGMHPLIEPIFGSAIVVPTFVAIILNLTLPGKDIADESELCDIAHASGYEFGQARVAVIPRLVEPLRKDLS